MREFVFDDSTIGEISSLTCRKKVAIYMTLLVVEILLKPKYDPFKKFTNE